MVIFMIITIAWLLVFLPLQWQLPFDFTASLFREPWNGPTLLLSLVSGFFYLTIFVTQKKWLNYFLIRNCLFASLLLLTVFILQLPLSPRPAELFRLYSIIWFIPVLDFSIRILGTQRLAVLLISILTLHALWGLGQFSLQRDFQLDQLGETQLRIDTPGIAKFLVTNTNQSTSPKLLRAYGPYPHPNSLGGALVIGLSAVVPFLRRHYPAPLTVILGFILLGIVVTFSRSAWIATTIALFFLYLVPDFGNKKFRNASIVWVIGITLLVFVPLWYSRLTDPQDVAAGERLLGTAAAWELITRDPWWGVGMGQYQAALVTLWQDSGITYSPWQIAPVHSVPLLLLAQYGIAGTLLLLLTLIPLLHQRHVKNWLMLLPLLPLLLFDHYLFTQIAPLTLALVWVMLATRWAPRLPPGFPAGARPPHS